MNLNQSTKDKWDAQLYDGKHSFVSKHGNSVVELLNPKKGERILDLGCGTGDLANALFERGVDVVGVDHSARMVNQAIDKYPHIRFIVQDATKLEFQSEFDAVFSNATLHWVKPPLKALQGIYQSLKPGGRFVAEFGGKGNIETLSNEIRNQIEEAGFDFTKEQFPWYFPSIAEYTNLMEMIGFKVAFAQHFERPTRLEGENGLRNWIEMFGSQLFEGIPEERKKDIILKVEKNVKDTLYQDGNWFADYKRIRVIGLKQS
ncbi:class I SAM-dependent methyltransferase [Bacillus alkalicellulosilyticus]|uniref:class I SAM-dependent methyltransferase n=1 Tax=Alkalihalobacterium alkalicellulosilyticum TaxID=1912214 RepID=UPI000995F5C2|nr:class I SAM-dependent methyltransferase [Bacillus alkalicellulosilyticus]